MRKKSLNASSGFLFKYGGERGIDSLRSPLLVPSLGLAPAGPTRALFKNAPGVFVGQSVALRRSVQLAAPVVEPRRGFSSPLSEVQHAKKKPERKFRLFL